MEHMNIKIIIVAVVILIISLKLYKSKIKGYIGERLVGKKLKKLNKREYKVINNLLLKTTKGSTQIDHIVISKYGVFVIETKNYKGIIKGNEYDATRVVIKAVDLEGNILPYVTGSIHVECDGDISIIGPNNISLIGGSIAFWVKTLGEFKSSDAKIKISSTFNIDKEIDIIIK